MDFSKFRASGELSDIVVVVEGEENRLHKFPLYARSDYFCQLARSRVGGESEVARLELDNFPGGNEVFQNVADFCYNMPVSLAKSNVVPIRCAAEYLQMKDTGNLAEIADKFIQDTISSAKLSRSNAAILSMLMDCNKLGEISKSAGIVDACVDALVDCLSKTIHKFVPISPASSSTFSKVTPRLKTEEHSSPSAFSKVQTDSTTTTNSQEVLDEVGINCLVSIQSSWFSSILSKGKSRGIPVTRLGALAVRYVTSALERDSITGSSELAPKDSDETEKDKDTSVTTGALTTSSPTPLTQAEQIGNVLDTVILSLPEHAYSIPSVTMEWLTKVLRIATSRGCQCRGHLVRVAGEMLTHLGPEDLCIISPSVLHDIVEDANIFATTQENDDTSAGQSISTTVHSERACKLVDTYLGQMTSKGVLTSETFRLLASATKNYPRPSHDFLYTVLEFVLNAEKDKLSEDQRQDLVDIVNFDLLTEPNLQRALDGNVAPPTKVATSAVKLCSKLRTELESVKYIAEMQEQDIQKYQTVASSSSRLSPRSSPPLIKDPIHFSSYHGIERTTDTGFADTLDPGAKSPIAVLTDHDTSDDFHKTDALQAAQNVLNAARHKLALPVYTGYRPSQLTRLHSPSYASHSSRSNTVEHDISLEEELEFKFDRSFRSLDPRVRHHHRVGLRDNSHSHSSHASHLNNPRSYFPYSGSSYRY